MPIPDHLPWKPTGEKLGSGGQGTVHLVTHEDDPNKKLFAFKELHDPNHDQARKRFQKEIEAIKIINHPLIVKVMDHSDIEDDFLFYVMEYHPNAKTIEEAVFPPAHNPFHGNTLKCLDLFEQIIVAIGAYENQSPQITHRDINPQNILLLEDGSIRLIDFGICHFENNETITLTGENVGRRNYTAPECEAGGTPTTGVHSDFYSAAKTLWSVITSRRAFSREESVFGENSTRSLFPDTPEAWHLQRIFERSIRKDPANRFQNTEDALGLLAEVRYKLERKLPTSETAHTRCPSCGGKSFSELPGTQNIFGSPDNRNFNVVHCNSCGFVVLRSHNVWQQVSEARSRFQ